MNYWSFTLLICFCLLFSIIVKDSRHAGSVLELIVAEITIYASKKLLM